MSEAQLLAAFDANNPRHRGNPLVLDWLKTHDVDPDWVRRAEVRLLDAPFIRLTEYVKGADGRPQVNLAKREALTAQRDVLLKEPAPVIPGG